MTDEYVILHVVQYASKGFLQGGMTNVCTPLGAPQTPRFGAHLPGPQSTGAPAYPTSAYHQIPCASDGSFHACLLFLQHFSCFM